MWVLLLRAPDRPRGSTREVHSGARGAARAPDVIGPDRLKIHFNLFLTGRVEELIVEMTALKRRRSIAATRPAPKYPRSTLL